MNDHDVRQILARNLRTLMDSRRDLGSILHVEKATREAGNQISKSTLDRLLRAESPGALDHLTILAVVFGLEPWQLLVPDLNYRRPPRLLDATQGDDETIRVMMDFAKIIKGLPDPGKKR